jgi:hypothetical protein
VKTELVDIETLTPDPHNARKHGDKNLASIRGSIKQFGVVEPLIVQRKNNVVIGGNGRLEVLKQLGFKEVPVHYVDLDDTKAKALALALNKTAELAEWDDEILKQTLDALLNEGFEVEDIGFDIDDIPGLGGDGKPDYTKKIEAPIYEIKGEKPDLKDLVKGDKVKELIEKIDNSNIPPKEKEFLRTAAYRHYVFDYQNIAEYYAHAAPETQALMESSALVIIDFNKAIENGFVKLSNDLAEAYDA